MSVRKVIPGPLTQGKHRPIGADNEKAPDDAGALTF